MQLLADLLDRPVKRGSNAEVSAFGAARMAAESLGVWSDNKDYTDTDVCFQPDMAGGQRDAIVSRWQDAILRAKFTADASH